MKIKMIADASYRISSGMSQDYRAGHEYTVPQNIGEDFVSRDVAKAVTGKKPTTNKEKHNGNG